MDVFPRAARLRIAALAVLGTSLVAACSDEQVAPPSDASVVDEGAELDAHIAPDAPDAPLVDAGVDGGAVDADDAAAELDGGCVCAFVGECTGCDPSCAPQDVDDGRACLTLPAETHLCLAGACVVRGCGDGLRELTELCDDGNTTDGDTCSAACVPTPYAPLSLRPTEYARPTAGIPTLARDGLGNLLFIWTSDGAGASTATVFGQRLNHRGALVGEPIVVADSLPPSYPYEPNAAGLTSGGFVVVYTTTGPVRVTHVGVDGTVAPSTVASDESTFPVSSARVVPQGEGAVVVYVVNNPFDSGADPSDGVRARLFDSGANPRGASFAVPADTGARERSATVASSGDSWAVAWTAVPLTGTGTGSALRMRRFVGSTPMDAADLPLAPDPATRPLLAAIPGTADFAIAYSATRTAMDSGDVFARNVSAPSTAYDPLAEWAPPGTPLRTEFPVALAAWSAEQVVVAWTGGTAPNQLTSSPTGRALDPDVLAAARVAFESDARLGLLAVDGGAWLTYAARSSLIGRTGSTSPGLVFLPFAR